MRVIKSKRVISEKVNKLIRKYGYLQCLSMLLGYTAKYGFADALRQYKSQGTSRKFVINYIHRECNATELYAKEWTTKINNLLKED